MFCLVLDSTENKENETIDEVGEAVLTLPDMETIDGILETIAISFLGIKDQLEKVKCFLSGYLSNESTMTYMYNV